MKIKNLFLLAFLFLFAAACENKSDDPTPPTQSFDPGTFGFFVENQNKRVWENKTLGLKIEFKNGKLDCYKSDELIESYEYRFTIGNEFILNGTWTVQIDPNAGVFINSVSLVMLDINNPSNELKEFFNPTLYN